MTENLSIPPNAIMVHEPHGFVSLVKADANDLDVVNSARVSYGKRSTELTGGDEGLIGYLLAGKHGTPFEHNFFCIHVRAPLFVLREWHRHRIGWSYNEESARYVELKPDFYIPDPLRRQVGRPGHYYTYEDIPEEKSGLAIHTLGRSIGESYSHYLQLLHKAGVAKEIARMVLPVSVYSQMYATCNARSLMNFLALRNSDTAMKEIKDYAEVLEGIFQAHMPVTHAAFIANGRVAP